MQLNLNISGYEGPLDLLLELSKKQKVDIRKISILELANQYLDFIDQNVNQIKLSADYLVMASLLALLKSKLLLPEEEKKEEEDLQEDLTQRLIHYAGIKKLSKKIFDLPQNGKDFLTIKIKNKFTISSKVVPKVDLQDIILKYLIINNRGKTIKMLADETDLYSVEDGAKWLNQIFQIKENDWISLFDFLPRIFKSSKKRKSAIVSILLASLNEVSTGKLLLNQESHFEKIMVKERK